MGKRLKCLGGRVGESLQCSNLGRETRSLGAESAATVRMDDEPLSAVGLLSDARGRYAGGQVAISEAARVVRRFEVTGAMTAVLWACLGVASNPTQAAPLKETAGWLETLVFPDNGLEVTAKLDTGAKSSAIDAENVENFLKDGQPWVRFSVRSKKGSDDKRVFEARVTGKKRIRTSFGQETRRTVNLWVCLGGLRRRVLFTLGERDTMIYRVILGRRALEGRLVVDSEMKFLLGNTCPDVESSSADDSTEPVEAAPAAAGAN